MTYIDGLMTNAHYLYCGTCKYKNVKETDPPCNTCMVSTAIGHSHVPNNYKDSSKKEEEND